MRQTVQETRTVADWVQVVQNSLIQQGRKKDRENGTDESSANRTEVNDMVIPAEWSINRN